LESLTDTHWELARRNGIGHYEPCDLQSINDGDSDRLILRTREMMKNPKLACKGLNELWNAEAYLDEMSLNGRAQAVVSVESISPVWMNRGKEGQLAHGRSALKAAKKPPGTVPILRSLRSKMGLSPSPMRFFSASY